MKISCRLKTGDSQGSFSNAFPRDFTSCPLRLDPTHDYSVPREHSSTFLECTSASKKRDYLHCRTMSCTWLQVRLTNLAQTPDRFFP